MLQNAGEATVANIDKLLKGKGSTPTAELRLTMQKTMQNHAAVFRDGVSLKEGCNKLDSLNTQMSDLKVSEALLCCSGIRDGFKISV